MHDLLLAGFIKLSRNVLITLGCELIGGMVPDSGQRLHGGWFRRLGRGLQRGHRSSMLQLGCAAWLWNVRLRWRLVKLLR